MQGYFSRPSTRASAIRGTTGSGYGLVSSRRVSIHSFDSASHNGIAHVAFDHNDSLRSREFIISWLNHTPHATAAAELASTDTPRMFSPVNLKSNPSITSTHAVPGVFAKQNG